MAETWTTLKYKDYDFGEQYLVSDEGNVRKGGYVLKPHMVAHPNSKPVKKVHLMTTEGTEIQPYVKKLVAGSFCEGYNGWSRIRHKDGDPSNCRLTNLHFVNRPKKITREFWIREMINGRKINPPPSARQINSWSKLKNRHLTAAIRGAQYIMAAQKVLDVSNTTDQAVMQVIQEQVEEHLENYENQRN